MKALKMIFVFLILFISGSASVYGEEITGKPLPDILIVYQREGNDLTTLKGLITSLGKSMEVVFEKDYKNNEMERYDQVLILKNADQAFSNMGLKTDLQGYQKKLLYLGEIDQGLLGVLDEISVKKMTQVNGSLAFNQLKTTKVFMDEVEVINQPPIQGKEKVIINGQEYAYSQSIGNMTYVPFFNTEEKTTLFLGGILKDWLGIEGAPSTILFVKEIFPFSDLTMIAKMADAFYENGIPFTLGVIPLSDNTDYPAMQIFYETLKYVQSKNGSIIAYSLNPEFVERKNQPMEKGLTAMINSGVYPLGVFVPQTFVFQNYPYENVEFSSGVVGKNIYEEDENISKFGTSSTSFLRGAYGISLNAVKNTLSTQKQFGNYPVNTAIMLDLPKSEEELNDLIKEINGKWLSLTDYKTLDNQIVIGKDTIVTDPRGVFLNGKGVSLEYVKTEIDKNYQYQPIPTYSLGKVFNTGNTFLLTIVGIIILGFLLMLYISRRLYLNKFRTKKKKRNKRLGNKKEGDIE